MVCFRASSIVCRGDHNHSERCGSFFCAILVGFMGQVMLLVFVFRFDFVSYGLASREDCTDDGHKTA